MGKYGQEQIMKLDVDNYQLTKNLQVSILDALDSVKHVVSLRKQIIVAETKLTCAEQATSDSNKKYELLQKDIKV